MWTLDEESYYISLINDDGRKFSNWTGTGFTATNYTSNPIAVQSPFPSSNVYSSFTKSSGSAGTIQIVSPNIFSASNISTEISTFCVNFFIYQNPTYITAFRVGYKYNNSSGTPQTVISANIPPPATASWINFNNSYNLPTSWSGSVKIFIEVDFISSSGGDAASRTITMHGLSVGQDSEATCYVSLGSTPSALPTELNMSSMYGVSSDQYGVLSDNTYLLIRNNLLLAHNDGLPIIYGTDNSTKIVSPKTHGIPSLVFPGKGMLHNNGRNKSYTLEMWIKIDPQTTDSLKILGPLDTTDGVYVKEGFLTLVVDNEIASHSVSEWYRPMLIHILIRENTASIMINGEQVISIPFSKNTATLSSLRDWWGIYTYDSINMFEVDCISIFPYAISNFVAKRRFIYGQGTPSVQSIDNAYRGTPTTIEFATSEYDSNIIYPDIARWDAGYFNNLNATKDYLSVPNYSLPIINIGGRDLTEWYADNLIVNNLEYPNNDHPHFISFRPNTVSGSWNPNGIKYQENCYLNFPTLNILNNQLSAVYGIFEIESVINYDRTLISFANVINGDTFDIVINGNTIKYSLNNTLIYSESATIGMENLVGVTFESLGNTFGYDVSRFFSSPSSIQMYVGGNGTNTFEGKIYLIGFVDQIDYANISDNFRSNGTAIASRYQYLFEHFTSYTLIPEYEYGRLFLDIAVYGQWEEYFPLSYFATYVNNQNGDKQYDLDMLQINIGYSTVAYDSPWKYFNLKLDNAVATSYTTLKNSVYSSSYLALKKKNATSTTIDISSSSIQSYVTFQSLASGANSPLSSFSYTRNISEDGVIYADNENTVPMPQKAYQTKFAFKDNMIIYPPKSQNFNDYAMVVHLQIKQRSILKNPLKIKSFEISAKNLNYNSATLPNNQKNYIGTKWGKKAYIVTESSTNGNDYKTKNPILINKESTPYLYNAKKSGVKIINESTSITNQNLQNEIFIPINENGSYDYKIGAIQIMVNPSFIEGTGNIKMFEIKHKNGTYMYAISKNEDRAFLHAYDGSGGTAPFYGTSFYQNGKYLGSPVLKNNEWTCIGLIFTNEIDYSGYSDGGIKLFGGFTFNNISYYISDGLGIKSDLNVRTWQNVLTADGAYPSGTTWSYWNGHTWQYVYIIGQSTSYITTPKEIYQAYVGTNSNVIDDGYGIIMKPSSTQIITSASWQDLSAKPV